MLHITLFALAVAVVAAEPGLLGAPLAYSTLTSPLALSIPSAISTTYTRNLPLLQPQLISSPLISSYSTVITTPLAINETTNATTTSTDEIETLTTDLPTEAPAKITEESMEKSAVSDDTVEILAADPAEIPANSTINPANLTLIHPGLLASPIFGYTTTLLSSPLLAPSIYTAPIGYSAPLTAW